MSDLFANYDKIEDQDEFDIIYNNKILKEFHTGMEDREQFSDDLNSFISRLYRVNGIATNIEPGQPNQFIENQNFEIEAPKVEYLFHKLRHPVINKAASPSSDNESKSK